MKVYTEKVSCGICGGPAYARAGSNIWDGRVFTHRNPFVCIETLKKKSMVDPKMGGSGITLPHTEFTPITSTNED